MTARPDLQRLDPHAVARLPYHFAKRHGVLCVREADGAIEIWARSGVASLALAELQRALGRPLELHEFAPEAFDAALNRAYERGLNPAERIVGDLGDSEFNLEELAHSLPPTADLLENEDDAPIVRLINALLAQSVRENASDIHIEPFETRSVVRFRKDGVLRDIVEPPRVLHGVLVSRIKIMASMDIAEKRLPQDGRITLRLAGRPVDVRVSTLPTGHGERVVMRLLDKQAGRLSLPGLGMAKQTLETLDHIIHQPHGIILVTGPTGSGKTTTLYAALGQLDTKRYNIVTVEDPIEYDLDGVGQTQVNAKIDLSFARALRSILRQDPDIIMVGEIRDLETAQIAVQASLTGHLVLATLHTNDAVGAVTRLVDMGVEPFLVASSLLGVMAQRLVRKLCPECKRAHAPDAAERELLELPKGKSATIYSAAGCPACAQTGYQGRTGIYELLTVDDTIRTLIHDRAAESRIRDHAQKLDMKNLREDGLRWVLAGLTSLEEVVRVTRG
ncbi:MAG: type II secretion system protein GspE [Candidatus Muproteobacteria bacterium RBG_16_65_34]|uniref:Type II secretion system protein E n=1 Tax=Candidatus Muproteobacteria bacterium RBG_16_65_34 TaxID=1817760 RepID=A0A1F6TQ07_9PROT|nr:MAG: type II secretion system protein GspE [Candidatus Muproteobacteria bacterium RBG_16_65_34]